MYLPPPPPNKLLLAALTIASISNCVMSPCQTDTFVLSTCFTSDSG